MYRSIRQIDAGQGALIQEGQVRLKTKREEENGRGRMGRGGGKKVSEGECGWRGKRLEERIRKRRELGDGRMTRSKLHKIVQMRRQDACKYWVYMYVYTLCM